MVISISLLLSVIHKKIRDNYVIVCLCICVSSFVTLEPYDFYETKLELKVQTIVKEQE